MELHGHGNGQEGGLQRGEGVVLFGDNWYAAVYNTQGTISVSSLAMLAVDGSNGVGLDITHVSIRYRVIRHM